MSSAAGSDHIQPVASVRHVVGARSSDCLLMSGAPLGSQLCLLLSGTACEHWELNTDCFFANFSRGGFSRNRAKYWCDRAGYDELAYILDAAEQEFVSGNQ